MKIRITFLITPVIVVLLVFFPAVILAENSNEITILSYQGKIEIKNKRGGEWKPYTDGSSLTIGTEIRVSDDYKKVFKSITNANDELQSLLSLYSWLNDPKNNDINELRNKINNRNYEETNETLKKIKLWLDLNPNILTLLHARNKYSEYQCSKEIIDQWLLINDSNEELLFPNNGLGECGIRNTSNFTQEELIENLNHLIPDKKTLRCEIETKYIALKTVEIKQRIEGCARIKFDKGRIITLYSNSNLVINDVSYENTVLTVRLFLKNGRLSSTIVIGNPEDEKNNIKEVCFEILTNNAKIEYKGERKQGLYSITSFGADYDPNKNLTYVLGVEGCVTLKCRWYMGADLLYICGNEDSYLEGCSKPNKIAVADKNVIDAFFKNSPTTKQKSLLSP